MRKLTTLGIAIALATPLASCADDPSRDAQPQGTSEDDGSQTTGSETGFDPAEDPTSETTASPGPDDTGLTGDTGRPPDVGDTGDPAPPPFGQLPHHESFEGPDGAPWPHPWFEGGDQVISSELVDGRGRFDGQPGNVARMILPGFTETDVDVAITLEFEDWTRQGFGLYVRQNGGSLQQDEPYGQGYAAYVEGGFMRFLGVWRETNGVEEPLANQLMPGGELEPGVAYRLRFQCFTEGDGTRLRTRMWPVGDPEPSTWHVDIVDDTPELQGTAGSFAVDVYNYEGSGSVYVDDLSIAAY